ncbi:MAG: hypothetical protein LIO74_02110 [Ruminococcus sp.]|nr:hypothetical protein [Ruminococcus sp.]
MKTNAKKCGLLREGFRQCQMIGICALVLILLLVILQAISGYIDYSNENSLYTAQAYQMNLGALLAIPMTFFMTLRLFRFLNNRAASDFYHALPHKRLFLYGSFIGAIILWILIWVVGSMLVTTLLCCMQPNLQLLYNTILPYTLSVIFMCLLTASGTLLVMGITGTGFTNVVLSLVLLFIPRFCVAYFQMLLQNYLPFFLNRSNTGFFSNSSNLLFSLLASIFDFSDNFTLSSILTPTWKPLVYTLLLSLCYFGIGGFFFQRRRSEAAGQSAPSKYLQHCYRILITMIPYLFFTSVLTLKIKLGNAVDDAFLYVIIYVPIVLLYFIYELITTRKWKNLLTVIPGLGIVVLLNVGILFGVNLAYNQILSNRPDAYEIESISIYQGNDYDSDFYFTFSAYAGM